MSADESTRLRIRQYLIELMDEAAADAMMESMPPIAWTELATNADIARLDAGMQGVGDQVTGVKTDIAGLGDRLGGLEGRIDSLGGLEGRIDSLTLSANQTSRDLQELTATVSTQGISLGSRIDGVSERMDSVSERMDGVSERMDNLGARMESLGSRMDDMGRAVTIGAATMALMLATFIAGTVASLIGFGAFS